MPSDTAMLQRFERTLCSSTMQTCHFYLLSLSVMILCSYFVFRSVGPSSANSLIHHRNVSAGFYKGLDYNDHVAGEGMPRNVSFMILNHDVQLKGGWMHHRNASSVGFLMGLDYSDQLTAGGVNLFCLQCLASTMDHRLEVVEPFIVNSTFGVPLEISNHAVESSSMNSVLRLRDVYDLEEWVSYSKEKHFAPLVSWERFLDAAPRSIVLVQHAWGECSLTELEKMCSPLFQLINFNVIRKVCLYFKSTGVLSVEQYKRRVYGTLDPANVTVIFNRWMGIGPYIEKFTVSIKGSHCSRGIGDSLYDSHVTPSNRVESDVARYVSRYLNQAQGNLYIAVMVRTEMVIVKTSHRDNLLRLISQCVDNVVQKWIYMKKQSGLSATFVALDYGRYGSKGFYLHSFMNQTQLKGKLEQMLQSLEQGSLQEWEQRFGKVTSSQNPGYVASLQKTIASKARCLITAGGGIFQDHAFVLHHKVYGNSCHIQLKSDCTLLDTQVSMSPISLPSPSTHRYLHA